MTKISKQELNNIDGGANGDNDTVVCPNCHKKFKTHGNCVTKGSACHKKIYEKCPHCGHEW